MLPESSRKGLGHFEIAGKYFCLFFIRLNNSGSFYKRSVAPHSVIDLERTYKRGSFLD
jgi:hypothetical protein